MVRLKNRKNSKSLDIPFLTSVPSRSYIGEQVIVLCNRKMCRMGGDILVFGGGGGGVNFGL